MNRKQNSEEGRNTGKRKEEENEGRHKLRRKGREERRKA